MFRSSLLLWINNNKDLVNRNYSDEDSEEEVTKMLAELKTFREIQLKKKEASLKFIQNIQNKIFISN